MSCEGLIIAGGAASRLGGGFKPLLRGPAGESILALTTATLRAVTGRPPWLSCNRPELIPEPGAFAGIVPDVRPGEGPIAGLLSALPRLPEEACVLVVAGDMPWLQASFLSGLWGALCERPEAPGLMPERAGRALPFPCALRPRIAPALAAAFEGGERSLWRGLRAAGAELWEEASWLALDPEGLSLNNVNTPDELAAWRGEGL